MRTVRKRLQGFHLEWRRWLEEACTGGRHIIHLLQRSLWHQWHGGRPGPSRWGRGAAAQASETRSGADRTVPSRARLLPGPPSPGPAGAAGGAFSTPMSSPLTPTPGTRALGRCGGTWRRRRPVVRNSKTAFECNKNRKLTVSVEQRGSGH